MKLRFQSVKDLIRQFWLLGNFVVLVYRRFKEERCFQLCGSLTFTTMLALVPSIGENPAGISTTAGGIRAFRSAQ